MLKTLVSAAMTPYQYRNFFRPMLLKHHRSALKVLPFAILVSMIGLAAPQSIAADLQIAAPTGLPAPRFRTTVTTGGAPLFVAPIDIDADGLPDFVTANYIGNSITIVKNSGNGVFLPTQELFVGGSPVQSVVVDLQQRGALDVVVCNSALSDPYIAVVTNNGSGTFALSERIKVGPGAVAIAAGDVNNDSKPDIITSDYSSNTLTVLTNDGSGHLQISQTLSTANFPHGVAAVDLDHDGWRDLVNCCWQGNVVQTFTNDQHGHFALRQTIPAPGNPHWMVTADFNGDGFIDVATSNSEGTFTVLTNDHTGGLVLSAKMPTTIGEGHGIGIGDWDGDGNIDLAVTSFTTSSNHVALFRNNGHGVFDSPSWIVGEGSPYAPAFVREIRRGPTLMFVPDSSANHVHIFELDTTTSRVQWPVTTAPWRLQEAADLQTNGWADSPLPILLNASSQQNTAIVNPDAGRRFFRLTHD
jgi:hypothetical protein